MTRQWTADRRLASTQDWAGEKKFKLVLAPKATLPDSLQSLANADPLIEMSLVRGPIVILKLTTAARSLTPRAEWHLMIRQVSRAWNPMALRPGRANASLVDLFSLNGFPALLPPERFIAFAGDSKDALAIASCSARGLLPADIGLLIHGPYVTLDFSARPFDPIEFNRMTVISDQLMGHLPQ